MTDAIATLAQRLSARLADKIAAVHEWEGETTLDVLPENWLAIGRALHDSDEFHFEQLIDVAGVDYLSYGQVEWDTTDVTSTGFSRGVEGESAGRFDWADRPRAAAGHKRFAVVVQLSSVKNNLRVRLRAYCQDDSFPVVPSFTSIWPGANWFEREAFDLFGILFEGHPDLRRILTDYGFVGHPFPQGFSADRKCRSALRRSLAARDLRAGDVRRAARTGAAYGAVTIHATTRHQAEQGARSGQVQIEK